MIVILGSRHDTAAAELLTEWSGAALCSAEDLVHAGWVWPLDGSRPRRWVVRGRPVSDREVSGVFVRRSAVYPEELASIHPDDRAYMAAEAQAFVSALLATTAARVVNPVRDGAFGEETLRGEWLAAAAARSGVALAPHRSSSERPAAPRAARELVEVVDGHACSGASPHRRSAAVRLAAALGLTWALVAFDGRGRALGVTVSRAPGPAARAALYELLRRPVRRRR